jgi:hypothetical protein
MNLIQTENELLEALYKLKCNDIIDWIKKCNSNKVVKIKHSEFGVKMMNIAKIYNLLQIKPEYNCDKSEISFYNGFFCNDLNLKNEILEIGQNENCNFFGLHKKRLNDLSLNSQIIIDYKIKNYVDIDIVIAPRKKNLYKERNFLYWQNIVNLLLKNNLKIGVIGSKDSSETFENSNIIYSFDSENPSEECLKMLNSCKAYIGGDTGVTHLAHNFLKPSFLFRTFNHIGPNEIADYDKVNKNCEITYLQNNDLDYLNNFLFGRIQKFLEKHV